MTGLDAIIERILADARERARLTLEAAQNECRATAERYAENADEERERIAAEAEKEGTAAIARGRSAAAMARRNKLISARAALLDEAYGKAKAKLAADRAGKYPRLLTALTLSAIREEEKSEKESLALGDEMPEFSCFEIVMNKKDRDEFGAALLQDVSRARADGKPVRLADDIAGIDGGILLRYGDVCVNCSLTTIFAEARAETEAEIAALLFAESREEN